MNRTFTVTQLDQQSIGAASDEYEPVPRSFSTQMHLRRGNGDFKFTMFRLTSWPNKHFFLAYKIYASSNRIFVQNFIGKQ